MSARLSLFPNRSASFFTWLLHVFVLAAVYYGAARLGLQLAFEHTNASPVWPPSGIALAALLLTSYRVWPGIFFGAFTANFAVFSVNQVAIEPIVVGASASIALGNTLEALVGYYLLRRWAGTAGYLATPSNIAKLVIVVVFSATVSAGIGSSSLIVGNIAPATVFSTITLTWWLGDVAGMLIFTPPLLAWFSTIGQRWPKRSLREYLLSGLTLTVALYLVFARNGISDTTDRILAFALLPFVGWFAYRFGHRGVSLAVLIVSASAVFYTTRGHGPFAFGTLNESLLTLECFIALCSVTGLLLAADLSDRLDRSRTPLASPSRAIGPHWLSLLASLVVSVAGWQIMTSDTQHRTEERFSAQVTELDQRIRNRLMAYKQVLRSAQGLFRASRSVEREEWRQFVETLALEHAYAGIQGVGYAHLFPAAELPALELKVRADGYPDFRVWPKHETAEYTSIIFLEPFNQRNLRAFGFDMTTESTRATAMQLARDTGEATLSGKVKLKQETQTDVQVGFLMYLPVYRNGVPTSTLQERRAAIQGYVYAPFRANDFMQGILGQFNTIVALRIFDGDDANGDNLLYESNPASLQTKPAYPNPLTRQMRIVLDQHVWTLQFTTLPAFEATVDRQKSVILLLTGSFIGILLFFIVRNQMSLREEAVILADRMTRAFQDSELRFGTLINAASEFSVIATDPEGVIQIFSFGAQRMLGYSPAVVVKRYPLIEIHLQEEIAARSEQLSQELGSFVTGFEVLVAYPRRGHPDSREWTYVRSDGTRLPVQLSVTAMYNSTSELIGFLSIARDISAAKQSELALHQAKEQAETANRAKSMFLANMSHEIRTPMNAVLGITHLLAGTPLSSDQKNYLEMIRSAGQSLLEILNDILDFSKIEAGKLELSQTIFKLSDVLNGMATIMSVNSKDKDLELMIGVEPDVPQELMGDALRLQQILTNLVGNAIKFTEKGEVSVLVRVAKHSLTTVDLEFQIHDTGIGLSKEQQVRLFTPFSQADASTTRRFGGSGLGLAISCNLARLMGGDIQVHSDLGAGSTFQLVVTLQLVKSIREYRHELRILIVDDNFRSRDYLSKTIRSLGWMADAVASGAGALESIQTASNCVYDAVLVDWNMPGMDGFATLQAMRELPAPPSMLLIAMVSTFALKNMDTKRLNTLAHAVLLKPVTSTNLLTVVGEAVAGIHQCNLLPDSESIKHETKNVLPLQGARLLIVEDNPLNQVVAKGILDEAGAEVEVVDNGASAVELLRSSPARFQLILMDVQMPVMDGITATQIIRDELKLTLPILALTAGVLDSEREKCITAGMNAIVAKPIDIKQLFKAIEQFIPAKNLSFGQSLAIGSVATTEYSYGIHFPTKDSKLQRSYMDLLKRMVVRGVGPIDEAIEAWLAGRHQDAARIFHTLRGTFGIFGSQRFIESTTNIENAMLEKNQGAVEALFPEVKNNFIQLIVGANSWLVSQPQATSAAEITIDSEAIEHFCNLLEKQNLSACEYYQIIRKDLTRFAPEEVIVELDNAMDSLNFAAVLKILRQYFPLQERG